MCINSQRVRSPHVCSLGDFFVTTHSLFRQVAPLFHRYIYIYSQLTPSCLLPPSVFDLTVEGSDLDIGGSCEGGGGQEERCREEPQRCEGRIGNGKFKYFELIFYISYIHINKTDRI